MIPFDDIKNVGSIFTENFPFKALDRPLPITITGRAGSRGWGSETGTFIKIPIRFYGVGTAHGNHTSVYGPSADFPDEVTHIVSMTLKSIYSFGLLSGYEGGKSIPPYPYFEGRGDGSCGYFADRL